MPATSKKVTTKAAAKKIDALAEGIRKVRAANAAKAAKKAASLKAVAKATTKVLDKPKAARKAPVRMVSNGESVVGGAKGKIIAMIAETKAGVSAAEIAKAIGWPRAGGTISRAIKLAGFEVAKVRDAEGVLRYSRKA